MPLETFLALVSFTFVTSFTPGPNNIMITASAANFGFARSVPHMLGVTVGFAVLLVAAGGGLGALLTAFPSIQTALKVMGAAYMLWLAWKVANAGSGWDGETTDAHPLTFLQAAAFQWVNPKGVIIALGAIALYVRPESAVTDFLCCWRCLRWRACLPLPHGPASAWRSAGRCATAAGLESSTSQWRCFWSPASFPWCSSSPRTNRFRRDRSTCRMCSSVLEARPTRTG